ncbi:MAG TPA: hypothetical protein P5568_07950 [Acidobacteriota bacterium]|nr:hypothetical protein [Acidobacteriota bacterium]
MHVLVPYDSVAHPPLRGGWGDLRPRRNEGMQTPIRVFAHNSQAMDVDLAPITDIFTMPLVTTSAGSPTY